MGPGNCMFVHLSDHTTTAESSQRPYMGRSRKREREVFIDNLLVRIHLIIKMIVVDRPCNKMILVDRPRTMGEFPCPGSLISTFLRVHKNQGHAPP